MSVFLLSKLPILKKVYFAKCSSQPKIHFATGGKNVLSYSRKQF